MHAGRKEGGGRGVGGVEESRFCLAVLTGVLLVKGRQRVGGCHLATLKDFCVVLNTEELCQLLHFFTGSLVCPGTPLTTT